MKRRTPLANPFYVALLLFAALFAVSGAAYALWLSGAFREAELAGHPLAMFLHDNGERLLLIQLGILAVLTLTSLATDEWWRTRRNRSESRSPAHDSKPNEE